MRFFQPDSDWAIQKLYTAGSRVICDRQSGHLMVVDEVARKFANRIDINLLVLALGGLVALSIALITISYHTVRSARAYSVKSLWYE